MLSIRENRVVEAASIHLWDLGAVPAVASGGLLSIALILSVLLASRRGHQQSAHGRHRVQSSRAHDSREILRSGTRLAATLLPTLGILGLAAALWIGSEQIAAGAPARLGFETGVLFHGLGTTVLLLGLPRHKIEKIGAVLALGLAASVVFFVPAFDRLGILVEAANQQRRLVQEVLRHIQLTLVSVGVAGVLGLPIAILAQRNKRFRAAILPVINTLQTIPSIALFGLLIAPLAAISQAFPVLRELGIRGIGNTPALIALSLYAIYPVVRYTLTALNSVPAAVLDAGRGMGMSPRQMSRLVRIPLALPGILHGFRVAVIQTLGNATLAKLIGGNGLGVFVFEGLGQASSDLVVLGMILIVVLTVVADQGLGLAISSLTPRALRDQYKTGVQTPNTGGLDAR